ncbi:DUF3320 domain-containing protein [Paenirhodobacter sp. CAU 1674]|uniref:DUF3320 domain-containing protein n=1 Tax=Paenirhodobacter sp. CAU 1674 TaxID=3032596 RepID=UPI0023DC092B|nr:DUF3320 domain-containing protein [Paenirhodobacter sp. CAU 1674]MDF2141733.1 DUF3320 domain-containing protein [Paenirhodobacter sp. CAU 1674]
MLETNTYSIIKVLESSRRKLLDTGTRNRLVHVNRENKRANWLSIINERTDDIYALLRDQSKRMRFKAMGKDKSDASEETLFALPEEDLEEGSARYTDLVIETPLGPDALARRLLRLAHDARIAEEEQGLNILYLAMGFLKWREAPSSEIWREAPLILLPVRLIRNERTSTYDVVARDDDITTNLPLQERLRQDFGIALPEVEEGEGWAPAQYFDQVAEAISSKPDWSIDWDGMLLGFFSFAKLLMHRDLDPVSWSDAALSENPLLQGLLAEGFPEDKPFFGVQDKLDDILDPAQIIQVIDADASQTKVIEEVRKGASLVVQGPPGTGKSQTITNIIAAAAHDGKTVLFVAEKMAALSVVYDRLVKVGLRDVCLELHSRTANKKALAQELGRTLAASARELSAVGDPGQLRLTRDELNRISRLLHTPVGPASESPFLAISEIIGFIGKGAPAPSIALDSLETLTRSMRDQAVDAIEHFISASKRVGEPEEHPFRGTRNLDLQPTDLARLENEIDDAVTAIDELLDRASEVSVRLHISAPKTLSSLTPLVEKLKRLDTAPPQALALTKALFGIENSDELRQKLKCGQDWAKTNSRYGGSFLKTALGFDLAEVTSALVGVSGDRFKGLNIEPAQMNDQLRLMREEADRALEEVRRVASDLSQPMPKSLVAVKILIGGLTQLQSFPQGSERLVARLFDHCELLRLEESIAAGLEWSKAFRSLEETFSEDAWEANVSEMRATLMRGRDSFFARLSGGYRRASAALAELLSVPLPTSPAERVNLVEKLSDVQSKRRHFRDDEDWLREILGSEWRNDRTPFDELEAARVWLKEVRATEAFETVDDLERAVKQRVAAKNAVATLERAVDALEARMAEFDRSLGVSFSAPEEDEFASLREGLEALERYRNAIIGLSGYLSGAAPTTPAESGILVRALGDLQAKYVAFTAVAPDLSTVLGLSWRGENTDFSGVRDSAEWIWHQRDLEEFGSAEHLAEALSELKSPGQIAEAISSLAETCRSSVSSPLKRLDLDLDEADLEEGIEGAEIDEIANAFAKMRGAVSGYGDWARYQQTKQQVYDLGAGGIEQALADGRLKLSGAVDEFLYACAEARWNDARKRAPELSALPTLDRHELVRVFRSLEADRIAAAKNLILSRHFEQLPKGTMGEMSVIRGEIARKRGHKPIRWVIKNAGGMVQRIKPVLLMSPLSVAQFLPPSSVTFDLLVIDEASQIRPEDALGVIARARQIVVVGDQKQLPPTSFFDRLTDDSEDNEDDDDTPVGATAADMESILSLCEARGLRARMLEWHYRSRDPSLIRVSNAEFYGDKLVLPPSPLQLDADYGMKFTRVPGVYARGGSGLGRQGTNRIEAQAVVKAVAAHARKWPDLSLGVVAFSKAQSDMLTEVLELERRIDPVLDAFLREGRQEDVFVKNIENVQGDERDVILISVGYGPQEPNGRLASMSFGPINGEGGERRLNVLFSRARVRCEVFASFDPGDIDPSRSSRVGPRVLKRFLDFAKTGMIDERVLTGLEAESPFEEDVAAAIRDMGYLADLQVGTAGFRIDIGVRHPDLPGQYLVAVECDGAAYHAALWARERDRLRQDILENLGWKFHRIWSTDWFHHRPREIERLREALDAAHAAGAEGHRVKGANSGGRDLPEDVAGTSDDSAPPLEIGHLELTAPAYERFDMVVRSAVEPHEAPLAQLAELVKQIVDVEGPIHIDEVGRRISSAFGKQRTGNRIVEATRRAVNHLRTLGRGLHVEGDFLLTDSQVQEVPVRDRSGEAGSLIKAVYLPPMEVRAAANRVAKESGEMPPEEMVRAVARLLGFQRVGPDLAQVIGEVLVAR